LVNIIKGDLSLVGPRPVTAEELSRYGDDVAELLSVRPGLTGYWQISGRSALDYDERVRLDLAYVKAWSLKLDLRILLKSSNLLTARTRAV
jgi:exopolysaccharide production protein ExoY